MKVLRIMGAGFLLALWAVAIVAGVWATVVYYKWLAAAAVVVVVVTHVVDYFDMRR